MFHGAEAPVLMTVREIAEILRRSEKTVRRWVGDSQARTEFAQVPTSSGNTVRQLLVDVRTLPESVQHQLAAAGAVQAPLAVQPARAPTVDLARTSNLEDALAIIQATPEGERAELVAAAAKHFKVSRRTIYRRLAPAPDAALDKRSDAGRWRIPQAARQLVVHGFATNPPTTSARMLHRTLMRAAPDAMTYERAGELQTVSVRTVQRIRQELLENPQSRLLLSDTDERAEYIRVSAGTVLVEHANALWQMDMTRCDVLVVDPSTGKIYRPRVHAIIDTYSGAIPGIAFSDEEGQAQTDLTLLRALSPKRGPYADRYPYFGVPKRIYWDNGSTYQSAQSRRVIASLGIEDVHSRPYVSHTRGKIERFFGTLHNLEAALPGYVGENAVLRSSKEIKRLSANTRGWLKHGRDPGDGNRLLTIAEYQNVVLAWLVVEYHQWDVDGKSRHDHFVETAPASTLVEIDHQELLLLLAHRVERTVDAAGRIRMDNRYWVVPDGSLAPYQNMRVLVLTDQFALEPDRRLVAWVDRRGALQVIGEVQPAPEAAASIEAQDQRRAARAALVEEARRQREMKRELTDPNLRVSTVFLKEFRAAGGEPLPPSAQARLEALNPPEEVIEFAADDVIGQRLANPLSRFKDAPTDPIERIRWANEHLSRRGRNDK